MQYLSPIGNPPAVLVSWSPVDATKMLVSSSSITSGKADLKLLDIPTGSSIDLARLSSGPIIRASWSPDGKFVALTMVGSVDGSYKAGLSIVDVRGGTSRFVSEKENGEAI